MVTNAFSSIDPLTVQALGGEKDSIFIRDRKKGSIFIVDGRPNVTQDWAK